MKMNPGPDWDPDYPVPVKWRGYEFEYRHGYSWHSRPFVHNPVSAVRMGEKAREAWYAGRKWGQKEARMNAEDTRAS